MSFLNRLSVLAIAARAPLLSLAESIDAWRVFPRVALTSYAGFCWTIGQWYMTLPHPTTEQTAFATTVLGLAVPLTGWYMQTGRRWQ